MTFNIDNIKKEYLHQHEKRQTIVFECLKNMVSQNTTTNGYQTHNTIQNLKFGMYLFIVLLKHNRLDDRIKHNLH